MPKKISGHIFGAHFNVETRERKSLNRWSQTLFMNATNNKCVNLAENKIMGRGGTYENPRLQALPVIIQFKKC